MFACAVFISLYYDEHGNLQFTVIAADVSDVPSSHDDDDDDD